jgi:hypothetical protein
VPGARERGRDRGSGVPGRRVELGLGEEQAVAESSPAQIGAPKIRAQEVSLLQVRLAEVGADQVGPAQACAVKVDATKLGANQVGALTVGGATLDLVADRLSSSGPTCCRSPAAWNCRSSSGESNDPLGLLLRALDLVA